LFKPDERIQLLFFFFPAYPAPGKPQEPPSCKAELLSKDRSFHLPPPPNYTSARDLRRIRFPALLLLFRIIPFGFSLCIRKAAVILTGLLSHTVSSIPDFPPTTAVSPPPFSSFFFLWTERFPSIEPDQVHCIALFFNFPPPARLVTVKLSPKAVCPFRPWIHVPWPSPFSLCPLWLFSLPYPPL